MRHRGTSVIFNWHSSSFTFVFKLSSSVFGLQLKHNRNTHINYKIKTMDAKSHSPHWHSWQNLYCNYEETEDYFCLAFGCLWQILLFLCFFIHDNVMQLHPGSSRGIAKFCLFDWLIDWKCKIMILSTTKHYYDESTTRDIVRDSRHCSELVRVLPSRPSAVRSL